MKKWILSIFLFLVTLGQGYAALEPFGMLYGNVLDSDTRNVLHSAEIHIQGCGSFMSEYDGSFSARIASSDGGKMRVYRPGYLPYYYYFSGTNIDVSLTRCDDIPEYTYHFIIEDGLKVDCGNMTIDIPANSLDLPVKHERRSVCLSVKIVPATIFTNVPPGGWEYYTLGGESVGTIAVFQFSLFPDGEYLEQRDLRVYNDDLKIRLRFKSEFSSDLPATVMRFDEKAFNWDYVETQPMNEKNNHCYDFELHFRKNDLVNPKWYCCHIFKDKIRKVNLSVQDSFHVLVPHSRFHIIGKTNKQNMLLTNMQGTCYFYTPLSCNEFDLIFDGFYLVSTEDEVNWEPSGLKPVFHYSEDEDKDPFYPCFENTSMSICIDSLSVYERLRGCGIELKRPAKLKDKPHSMEDKLHSMEDKPQPEIHPYIGSKQSCLIALVLVSVFGIIVLRYYATKLLTPNTKGIPSLIVSVLSLHPIFSERQQELVKNYFAQSSLKSTGKYLQTIRNLMGEKIDLASAFETVNRDLSFTERRVFLQLLFKLAADDDGIKNDEWQLLSQIMVGLKMNKANIDYLMRRYAPLRTEFEDFEQSSYSSNYKETSTYSYASSSDYELLGISVSSSHEEVQRAYHRLAKEYHPDLPKNANRHAECVRKMAEINLAYDRLMKG